MASKWLKKWIRVAALLVAAGPVLAAVDARADLAVTADPVSPVHTNTFDLSVWRAFDDSGYGHLDQSIRVNGSQIDVDVVIQDLHTQPGAIFRQVVTTSGAVFEDVGPLATGTYQVNARMWLASWPSTGPGTLYDTGSLTLHALQAMAAPEPGSALLFAVGAALLSAARLRRKLGQAAV